MKQQQRDTKRVRRGLWLLMFGVVWLSVYVSASVQHGNTCQVNPASIFDSSSPAIAQPADFVALLSEQGPQFPASLDTSDFSVLYIVRANWPIAINYELEEGASATLFVKPLQRGEPIELELRPTGIGKVREALINTPSNYGRAAQAAQLRFMATVRDSRGTRPANFIIHSLGCGGGAFAEDSDEGPRPRRHIRDRHFQPVMFREGAQRLASNKVAINGIQLQPSDRLNASNGGQLNFRFQSANDFNRWAVILQRQTKTGGTVWEVERTMWFLSEPIKRGGSVSKLWDGKNDRSRIVAGSYKLVLCAWTAVNSDGSALASFSSPAIEVK